MTGHLQVFQKHMQDDPSARLQGTQENSLPSHDSPTQGNVNY